jgi:hypothetical protein
MCQKRFIIQQECCMRWSLAANDHRQFARQRLDASMAKAGFLHPAAAVRAGEVEAAVVKLAMLRLASRSLTYRIAVMRRP